jgi:hypothetical protein
MAVCASTKSPWGVIAFALAGLALVQALPAEEVQSHGLLFERWLCDTFFSGYRPESYTQKWDIPAAANRNHGGVPVNPKVMKHGSPIGLGDARRQFQIHEPFLLVIASWEQSSPTEKRWVSAKAVQVEPTKWRQLWEPVTQADLDRLVAVIQDDSLTLDEARAQAKTIKAQPPFSEAVMQVNPKIDRSQRRLQCSLRFTDFFTHLAPKTDSSSQYAPSLFGVALPNPIASKPRSFAE